jgi:two-component system, cell cycle response regulator
MTTILLIEDNANNLELMRYLLQTFHYTVHCATDGAMGWESLQREHPDLILCDVQLPVMDGFAVAKLIKNDPVLQKIPLLAVTALAMVGDKERVLKAGFDGYITKPITPETFVQEVEAFLPPHQQRTATKQWPVETTAAPSVSPPSITQSKDKTILVVDNLRTNLDLTQTILESVGYRVLTVQTIAEAWEILQKTIIDLIVSDVHIHGRHKDGYDLLRQVKDHSQTRHIPFVFLSSTVWLDSERKNLIQQGAVKFIARPIDPNELLQHLAQCFNSMCRSTPSK